MAKQHDDPDQRRQPDSRKPDPNRKVDEVKDGEEVIDAGIDVLGHEHGPLTNPRDSSQPTWIAPFQEDAAEVAEPPSATYAPHPGFTDMPNLSLDATQPPPHAEVVEKEAAEVFEDEPLLAEHASAASSAIYVAEVVDDVDEDAAQVLSGEPNAAAGESSVVDISALVDEGSSNVLAGDAQPGSSVISADAIVVDSTVAPSVIVEPSSVVMAEPASEVALDAWADDAAALTPPPFEVEAAQQSPAHTNLPDASTSVVPTVHDDQDDEAASVLGAGDLDSAPDVVVDPSSVAKAKTEISQPAPAPEVAEADIDWDDIGPISGAERVARAEISSAKESDVVPITPVTAAGDEDFVADDDTVAEADSAAAHEAKTELDAAVIDGSDSIFDEDILADDSKNSADAQQAKSAEEEAAAIFADDEGNTPRPAKKNTTAVEKDVEFDDVESSSAKAMAKAPDSGAAHEANELAALAFLEGGSHAPEKEDGRPEVDDAVDLGAGAVIEDESTPEATNNNGKKDEALVGAGKGSKGAPRVKSGRGWLAGMIGTILVFIGAVAAIWYVKPDLLEQAYKSSPNAAPVKKERTNPITKAPDEGKLRAQLQAAEKNLASLEMKLQQADKDKADPAALQKALKDLSDNKSSLAAVNKLLTDANIKDAGDKGVAKLISAKKDVEDKLAATNKSAVDAKVQGEKGLAELVAARDKLAKDGADLEQALKIARHKGESPLVIPLTQVANALSGLGTGTAKMIEKGFDVGALSAELAFYRLREPLLPSPDRQLDTYLRLFQNAGGQDSAELRQAAKDSAWILSKEANSTPEARAKALYVAALADRDRGDMTAARTKLTDALKTGAAFKGAPWMKQAVASLKDMTEPTAYYLPRAKKLAGQGDLKGAQEVLDQGLKVFPNNPRLLTRRALLRLEAASGDRSQIEAAQKQVRQDAEAATSDAAAAPEAAYVLGLLEEDLGNFDKAEIAFRKAIKTHRGNADTASRYIIALARLLQRERTGSTAPAIPMSDGEPTKENPPPKKKEAAPKKQDARLNTIRQLLALAVVGVQFGDEREDDSTASARIQESIDLANKLIQSANPKVKGEGYMIRGQALSRMGQRTEGMREYVKGLALLFPGAQSKELAKLLQEHPAFQQMEAGRPNPMLAEQFYGKGLELFWSQDYPAAEKKFRKAVELYSQDARYQYFLAMSLWPQPGKRNRDAAYYAFEKAAGLEAANRPSMADVNISLERIQGPMRALVNAFRQKALVAAK